jgi:hypothetical protein
LTNLDSAAPLVNDLVSRDADHADPGNDRRSSEERRPA